MNDLMSGGVHRLWKTAMIDWMAPQPNQTLVDLAGGTGDISLRFLRAGGGNAVITDINEAMLSAGRQRKEFNALGGRVSWCVSNAEALPFTSASAERITIAFGLRNVTDREAAIAEAHRVLKPGGRFLCLEFSQVNSAMLARAYDAWSFNVLPRLGQLVAGDADSYRYLVESIRTFPTPEVLADMFAGAGFAQVSAPPVGRHRLHPFGMEAGLMRVSAWQMMLAMFRLPVIAWHLGRAGALGHIAKITLLPAWMRHLCASLDRMVRSGNARRDAGGALAEALIRLGPGFIKFGQALSTRADLIGPEMGHALSLLQDRLPAFRALARRRIEAESGMAVSEVFRRFDDEAVAAASIAQVHYAELADGRKVAVKLLRPGIHRRMQSDTTLFYSLASLLEWMAPNLQRLKLVTAVDQFTQISAMELD